MTDTSKTAFIYSFFIIIAASLFLTSAAVAASPTAEQQRQQLEALKSKVVALRKSLASARDQQSKQRQALREIETTIGKQINSLRKLNKDIHQQQNKLAVLNTQQQKLSDSLSHQKEVLGGQLRAAYAMGRQEYMKMLMNQEDPAVFGRTMRYYDYFNKARTQQIQVLHTTLTKLQAVEAQVVEENRQLLALRQSQQLAKQELDKDRQQRQQVLASLSKDIHSKEESLQSVLGDIAQLEQLLKGLQQALEDIPIAPQQHTDFKRLRGKLKLPVNGRILAHYGSRRKQGKLRWQGIMIDARQGNQVRAVSHGRVAFADWLRGFGLLIIIDHGDGYMSLYGHNQSMNIETGDWVEAGEVIATAGNSGGRQSTGLYFEIRHNGKPVNPLRWCSLARN